MFWSLPSTSCPSSRASAATPPMKVPAMPRMWSFTSCVRGCRRGGGAPASQPSGYRGATCEAGAPPPRLPRAPPASADLVRRLDRLDDPREHLVQRTHAVDHGQLALLAVELDHRRGLLVVDVEAVAHRFRAVVGAALGPGAAEIGR